MPPELRLAPVIVPVSASDRGRRSCRIASERPMSRPPIYGSQENSKISSITSTTPALTTKPISSSSLSAVGGMWEKPKCRTLEPKKYASGEGSLRGRPSGISRRRPCEPSPRSPIRPCHQERR